MTGPERGQILDSKIWNLGVATCWQGKTKGLVVGESAFTHLLHLEHILSVE